MSHVNVWDFTNRYMTMVVATTGKNRRRVYSSSMVHLRDMCNTMYHLKKKIGKRTSIRRDRKIHENTFEQSSQYRFHAAVQTPTPHSGFEKEKDASASLHFSKALLQLGLND